MMMTIVIICMMVIMISTTTMMPPTCSSTSVQTISWMFNAEILYLMEFDWITVHGLCSLFGVTDFLIFDPKKGRVCSIFCDFLDSFLFRRSRTCSRAQNEIKDICNLYVLSLCQLTFWQSRTCSKAPSPHHRR